MNDDDGAAWELSALRHELLTSEHPRIQGLPDHGLLLTDEEEAELRARAEAHGIDFDRRRREFELSHQVVPARRRGNLRNELVRQHVIPLNCLKEYFAGMIAGEIYLKRRRDAEESQ